MPSIKTWVQAARLRTLPLSVSGILVGSGMAVRADHFRFDVFVLAILATLGFQILSNYANDYGDGVKGTDNADRVGPARAMQRGLLTEVHLKNGMIVTALLTAIVVVILIYRAFGHAQLGLSFVYLILGVAAIIAAIKYTVGKSAYGYRGLGDLFVFLFFGLVGVMGSYSLYTGQLFGSGFLAATSIGVLSTIVLHLNYMRDRESDQKVGKNTLAVLMGKEGAVRYHNFLLGVGVLSWIGYLVLSAAKPVYFVSCVAFLPLVFHLIRVNKTQDHKELDPQLKKVALVTFFLSILFFALTFIIR